MSREEPVQTETYEVYCRECDWEADEPVALKGVANLLAGRHISRTGHVVALKTIEGDVTTEEGTAGDFYRGRSVSFEHLQRAGDAANGEEVRQCGPVECVVERE